MNLFKQHQSKRTLPESSIVLIGLVFVILGLVFRDSFGITSLLVAVGIGFIIAGATYIAVEGPEFVRLSLAFVSLVSLQLLSYGGIVRWVGSSVIGVVIISASYSRVSNSPWDLS